MGQAGEGAGPAADSGVTPDLPGDEPGFTTGLSGFADPPGGNFVPSAGARPDNPFQTLRTRTLIPFAFFGGIVLYGAFRIVATMTPIGPEDPAVYEIASMMAGYGAIALWVLWACRRSGTGIRRLVGRVPGGYNWYPVLGLLGVAGLFSLGSWYVAAYGLSLAAPGMFEWIFEVSDPAVTESAAAAVMWTLTAVVLAPLLEEVVFRGILVNRWGVKWGIRTGIMASAVLFGVCHLIDMAGATVFALIATILYLRTRTLIVPIAVHAANNVVAVLLDFVYPSEGPGDLATELQEIEAMALPGLGIAAVTLPVLVWYLRRHWPGRGAGIPYLADDRVADDRAVEDPGAEDQGAEDQAAED